MQAKTDRILLRLGAPDTPVWSLGGADPAIRFKRGEELQVTFANELPVPAALNWHGIDGVPAAEPLTARSALAPGARETFPVPLRHAGTFLCDLRLIGDGAGGGHRGAGNGCRGESE